MENKPVAKRAKTQFRFMIATHGTGIKPGESRLYLESRITGRSDKIADLVKIMADWLAKEGNGVKVES